MKKIIISLVCILMCLGITGCDKIVEKVVDSAVDKINNGSDEQNVTDDITDDTEKPANPYESGLYDTGWNNSIDGVISEDIENIWKKMVHQTNASQTDVVRLLSKWTGPYRNLYKFLVYYKGEYWEIQWYDDGDQPMIMYWLTVSEVINKEKYDFVDVTDENLNSFLTDLWEEAAKNSGELDDLKPVKILATKITYGMDYKFVAVDSNDNEKTVVINKGLNNKVTVVSID